MCPEFFRIQSKGDVLCVDNKELLSFIKFMHISWPSVLLLAT